MNHHQAYDVLGALSRDSFGGEDAVAAASVLADVDRLRAIERSARAVLELLGARLGDPRLSAREVMALGALAERLSVQDAS